MVAKVAYGVRLPVRRVKAVWLRTRDKPIPDPFLMR